MKTKKIVVGLLAAGSILASTSLMAGISTSKHNFTTVGDAAITAICEPCHVPHNPLVVGGGAPLWNHTATAASYTLYTSTTLNSTASQPDTLSKLCLGCHDGTIGVANYGGYAGVNTNVKIGSAPWNTVSGSNVGIDLSNDHPVGITYDTNLSITDKGLYNPSVKTVIVGGVTDTIRVNMMSSQDKMGCATCHDVHNSYSLPSLLKVTSAGSAICLACHNK